MRGGLAEALRDRGLEPVGAGPEETRAFFATEIRKWAEVAQRAGSRPE
jgi:tripartite-type tricarboxylate transporter receptor subunit TctC